MLPVHEAQRARAISRRPPRETARQVGADPLPAWTAGAEAELEQSAKRYYQDLRRLSGSLAATAGLDSVSAIHVQGARKHIRVAGRPRRRFRTAVGGVLLGVSLPNLLLGVASGEAIGPIGFVYLLLLLLSTFLIAEDPKSKA